MELHKYHKKLNRKKNITKIYTECSFTINITCAMRAREPECPKKMNYQQCYSRQCGQNNKIYIVYLRVRYQECSCDHSTNRLYCDASIVEYLIEDNVDTQKYIFV